MQSLLRRGCDFEAETVAFAAKPKRGEVVREAMYLLGFSWQAQKALWEILETGGVRLLPLDESDFTRMKQLMEKYRDLPMDLADAALVHAAEREDVRRILTLDQRDFGVYRRSRKGRFTLLP